MSHYPADTLGGEGLFAGLRVVQTGDNVKQHLADSLANLLNERLQALFASFTRKGTKKK